jgi:hypothetical protein
MSIMQQLQQPPPIVAFGNYPYLKTTHGAYTGFVAESLKVPADQFKAVIRALLNTPPSTQADMPKKKREPKQMNGPRTDRGFGGKKPTPSPRFPKDAPSPGLGKRGGARLGRPTGLSRP